MKLLIAHKYKRQINKILCDAFESYSVNKLYEKQIVNDIWLLTMQYELLDGENNICDIIRTYKLPPIMIRRLITLYRNNTHECPLKNILFVLSIYQRLTEDIIIDNADILCWFTTSKYQKITEYLLTKYEKYIDFRTLSANENINDDIIRKYRSSLSWFLLSVDYKFSIPMAKDFEDYIHWNSLLNGRKHNDKFITKFKHKFNWDLSSPDLSNKQIKKHRDKVKWNKLLYKKQKYVNWVDVLLDETTTPKIKHKYKSHWYIK